MTATNADTHTICKRIEKIEMLEQEKVCHLSRLLKEKEMLLQKVNELGEAMKEIESQTQNLCIVYDILNCNMYFRWGFYYVPNEQYCLAI